MKKVVLLTIGIVLMVLAPLVITNAIAYTMTLPRIYEAEAKIALHEDQADPDAFIRKGKDFIFNPLYFRAQFAIMESRQILYRVIDNLNLTKEWGKKFNYDKAPISQDLAYSILAGMVHVKPFRDTSLIAIRVRMEDGSEAALIANEIVSVYRSYRMDQKHTRVKSGIDLSSGGPEQLRNPVEIIDPAQPSSIPVSPNHFLNMLVGLTVAGGLFLAGLISVRVGVVSGHKKAMPPIAH